jgi:hypothetical protein
MRHRVPLLLFAPLVALLASCQDVAEPAGLVAPAAARTATDPLSKANRLPPDLELRVERFRADLESRGYEVARGYTSLWTAEDCKYPIQSMGFCYGNNPTSPYVIPVVPTWKDEFVDQSFHHLLFQAERGMTPIYRLDAQEALVILAKLPPPARYFSVQTYLLTREETVNPADPIYQLLASEPLFQHILFAPSPNPSRLMVFASVGNSVNDVVMARKSGSPWSKQRYFVITRDNGTAEAMTAALLRAGVPSADQVFTEPIAPPPGKDGLPRVGLGPHADDFVTFIRYAMPDDEASGDKWWATLPLTVMRVRRTAGAGPARPFPIRTYDARSVNLDERTLGTDLQALASAVRARWGQDAAPTRSFIGADEFLDLVGQHCLGYGSPLPNRGPMNCMGDGQDADYRVSATVSLDDGQVIAAVGTLGTATRNATYVSLGINRFPALVGTANLSDLDLAGTAAGFAGALEHDAGLFYVYYLARDCTGLHPCLQVTRTLVPAGETIKLIQRDYMTPGTTRGPDPARVLSPVLIVLDGRHRPTP